WKGIGIDLQTEIERLARSQRGDDLVQPQSVPECFVAKCIKPKNVPAVIDHAQRVLARVAEKIRVSPRLSVCRSSRGANQKHNRNSNLPGRSAHGFSFSATPHPRRCLTNDSSVRRR